MVKHRQAPPFTLRKYSKDSKALIREAQDAGWVFEMSTRGHAIGKAPDGVTTMAVPPGLGTTSPRGLLNARADFKRWLRSQVGT